MRDYYCGVQTLLRVVFFSETKDSNELTRCKLSLFVTNLNKTEQKL